jgi:molybdopterin-synthase adenylyltransferase
MIPPRYSRIARYTGFAATLPRWQETCCAVIGLGGLGGGIALLLARMGVRRLVLIDGDYVGEENLGHQPLYISADAGWPKAVAAEQHLRAANPGVEYLAHQARLNRHNAAELLEGAELLFDGLDNYYARLLLNDYALAHGVPYFYAGVVRGEISARAVVPGVSGCLRCLIDRPPAPGEAPLCAAEGVFPPLLGVANALQLDAANRYLAGGFTRGDDILYALTLPGWELRKLALGGPREGCPACAGRYEYLDGSQDELARQACTPLRIEGTHPAGALDLQLTAVQLMAAGGFAVRLSAFSLSAEAGELRYSVFPSGRVIMEGSDDPALLERFIAEYLGG